MDLATGTFTNAAPTVEAGDNKDVSLDELGDDNDNVDDDGDCDADGAGDGDADGDGDCNDGRDDVGG